LFYSQSVFLDFYHGLLGVFTRLLSSLFTEAYWRHRYSDRNEVIPGDFQGGSVGFAFSGKLQPPLHPSYLCPPQVPPLDRQHGDRVYLRCPADQSPHRAIEIAAIGIVAESQPRAAIRWGFQVTPDLTCRADRRTPSAALCRPYSAAHTVSATAPRVQFCFIAPTPELAARSIASEDAISCTLLSNRRALA
jgi:hypothetical protein